MDILIIIALIAIGLVLILVEVFLLPGVTIAALGAVILFASAIYYAFENIGYSAGLITVAASFLVIIGGVLLFMRTKMLKRMALDAQITSNAPTEIPQTTKVGDRGVSVTRLNPIGRVQIGDNQMEARAKEGFLDEDVEIEVIKVETTIITVKKIN